MAAAPPVRDSALEALGLAIRVLTKPSFMWAPIVLAAIMTFPILMQLLSGPVAPYVPPELPAWMNTARQPSASPATSSDRG